MAWASACSLAKHSAFQANPFKHFLISTPCCCSFAVVIQRLPPELRDAVCVFYLVLRALDTVEDDMAIAVSVKVPILRTFHEKIYDRCSSWLQALWVCLFSVGI